MKGICKEWKRIRARVLNAVIPGSGRHANRCDSPRDYHDRWRICGAANGWWRFVLQPGRRTTREKIPNTLAGRKLRLQLGIARSARKAEIVEVVWRPRRSVGSQIRALAPQGSMPVGGGEFPRPGAEQQSEPWQLDIRRSRLMSCALPSALVGF